MPRLFSRPKKYDSFSEDALRSQLATSSSLRGASSRSEVRIEMLGPRTAAELDALEHAAELGPDVR